MKTFIDNIQTLTLQNNFFRKVIYTGTHTQLVLMCLKPGEDIGYEVHDHVDQFFRVEQGEGVVSINGNEDRITDDFAIIVPAGAKHNLTNTGDEDLKLYTLYSPPNHPEETIHETRDEAMEAEEHEHH